MLDAAAHPDSTQSASERWSAHEVEQTLFIARNSTPQQRVEWLDAMLEAMKPHLERKDIPLDGDLDPAPPRLPL
jgi:hypothetical protein